LTSGVVSHGLGTSPVQHPIDAARGCTCTPAFCDAGKSVCTSRQYNTGGGVSGRGSVAESCTIGGGFDNIASAVAEACVIRPKVLDVAVGDRCDAAAKRGVSYIHISGKADWVAVAVRITVFGSTMSKSLSLLSPERILNARQT